VSKSYIPTNNAALIADIQLVNDSVVSKTDEIIASASLNTVSENDASALQAAAIIASLEELKARVDAPRALPTFSRYEKVTVNSGGVIVPENMSRRWCRIKLEQSASWTHFSTGFSVEPNNDFDSEWLVTSELVNTSSGNRTFQIWETYD